MKELIFEIKLSNNNNKREKTVIIKTKTLLHKNIAFDLMIRRQLGHILFPHDPRARRSLNLARKLDGLALVRIRLKLLQDTNAPVTVYVAHSAPTTLPLHNQRWVIAI